MGYLDYKNLDVATTDLEEMVNRLDASISRGGFDNDTVVWLIKAWNKVNVLSGITILYWDYWRFKREPPKLAGRQKRSQVLSRALDDYLSFLEKGPGNESCGAYYIARDAMLNFVWDYHLHIADDVNRETDFLHQLSRLTREDVDGLMQEEVFQMDRSM